jgi:magnesium-transporting ATPase (P-type)
MLFWYCYFTAVSGTSPFQSWVYSGYNLMLGLPAVFYGILDRDLSREFVEANPEVYATGKNNVYLSGNAVLGWIVNAVCYALILCAIFYYACANTFETYNMLVMGCIAYTGLVMSLQFKMMFMHNQWAYPQASLMAISILGMIIYYAFVQYWSYDGFYGAVGYMYRGSMFWLFGMFTVPLILMVFEALWYYAFVFFAPTNEMLYREMEHKEKFHEDMLTTEHTKASHESAIGLRSGIEMNGSGSGDEP